MSHIDTEIFNKVLSECPVEVESNLFARVILLINERYAKAVSQDSTADFKSIRNEVLDYCDLWDLLLVDPYKSAIGRYYSLRRAKEEKEGYKIGTIFEADENHVLIAASKNVKILFRSHKPKGKLRFGDIDTGRERFSRAKGLSTRVTEDQYLTAKRKALAVMNSRRKL